MKTYYRNHRGITGRRYRIAVPEPEIRGLVTTITVIASGLILFLVPAAYLLGRFGR